MAEKVSVTVDEGTPLPVERVQIGARIEKRMAKVLKGLAEFKEITLGELIEEIVLHSFEPVPGQEGQQCASPHSRASLQAIVDLKKVYGMDYGTHAGYRFQDNAPDSRPAAKTETV